MKYLAIYFLTLLPILHTVAQESVNVELKEKLDIILHKDQTLRELFDNNISPERKKEILTEFGYTEEDFKQQFWSLVALQDSLNLREVEAIITEHGYPGKTLVGKPTNNAAWYVIQHSNKIEKYFPKIKKAGDNGELSKHLVAMMEDRLLMDKGEEQIYGTQVAGRKRHSKAGEQWIHFVWPIKDPEKVNQLRKEVGFETTVEENAKRLNVDYKAYTLQQIDSLLGSN